jgi:hypothetical protein
MEQTITAKQNKNRATHKGQCQCCGAMQMLPAGVLAKHGYNVKWGFFSGVCQGSGSRPFETHTDLIERFITAAQDRREEAIAFQAECNAMPPEGTTYAWVEVFRTGNKYIGNHRHWMRMGITFTPRIYTMEKDGFDYSKLSMTYEHPDNHEVKRIEDYAGKIEGLNPLLYIQALNQKRAAAIQQEIDELDRYIAWQKSRLANWKEEPLTER